MMILDVGVETTPNGEAQTVDRRGMKCPREWRFTVYGSIGRLEPLYYAGVNDLV